MKVESISVDAVKVGATHRAVNPDVVSAIASSMKLIGQMQPITVYETDGSAMLIAGRHRLDAARSLGWDDIDAVFVTGDEIDFRLREIAENLHRADLTALQRDELIARWVQLVEGRKVAQVAPPGGKQPKERGVRAAAKELGVTRRAVQRAVKVASLSDEAKTAAKESGLDRTRSALLEVAQEKETGRQVEKVAELALARGMQAKRAANRAERFLDLVNVLENRARISAQLAIPKDLGNGHVAEAVAMLDVALERTSTLRSRLLAAYPQETAA